MSVGTYAPILNRGLRYTEESMKLNGRWISILHTTCAYAAFLSALFIGWKLHFLKIVKNQHYGYPQEWFPSVSASIGDRYPERSVFQILIALTCPFRLMLLILWYYCTSQGARGHAIHTKKPVILFIIGFVRTVTCGGWAYITSSDDHDAHDVFMILYMLLTLPYMLMSISTGSSLTLLSKISPSTSSTATKYRKIVASAFFLAIVPMVYYFIQHKVHAVAGAYSIYALFEWLLILLDVLFDHMSIYEFELVELAISKDLNISKNL